MNFTLHKLDFFESHECGSHHNRVKCAMCETTIKRSDSGADVSLCVAQLPHGRGGVSKLYGFMICVHCRACTDSQILHDILFFQARMTQELPLNNTDFQNLLLDWRASVQDKLQLTITDRAVLDSIPDA